MEHRIIHNPFYYDATKLIINSKYCKKTDKESDFLNSFSHLLIYKALSGLYSRRS